MDGHSALRQVEANIAATKEPQKLAALYSDLEDLGGYRARAREGEILYGLGFAPDQVDQPYRSFSGGWRIRLNLAQALMSPADLLLLDEPTNDLDGETLRALEDALVDFAGCAVVISHDRFFLDRICTQILAFEGEAHVEWFEGNFEDYEEDKKRRLGADALEPKRIKHKKFMR